MKRRKISGITVLLFLCCMLCGCAAAAGRAALECAAMNVFVNTRLLPENGRARELAAEAETMLREYIPRAQGLADSVTDLLRKPK